MEQPELSSPRDEPIGADTGWSRGFELRQPTAPPGMTVGTHLTEIPYRNARIGEPASRRPAVAGAGAIERRRFHPRRRRLGPAVGRLSVVRPAGDRGRSAIGLGAGFGPAPAGLDRHAQSLENESNRFGGRHLQEAVILLEGVERLREGRGDIADPFGVILLGFGIGRARGGVRRGRRWGPFARRLGTIAEICRRSDGPAYGAG